MRAASPISPASDSSGPARRASSPTRGAGRGHSAVVRLPVGGAPLWIPPVDPYDSSIDYTGLTSDRLVSGGDDGMRAPSRPPAYHASTRSGILAA